MGTRSLTVMVDTGWNKEQEICVLYRQYDGYVHAHGHELAEFLSGFIVTNGIRLGSSNQKVANGGNCLAAQLIGHFKKEVGGFYIYSAGTRDMGEEYIYHVRMGHDQPIEMIVEAYGKEIFRGTPEELLNFKEEEEEEEEK